MDSLQETTTHQTCSTPMSTKSTTQLHNTISPIPYQPNCDLPHNSSPLSASTTSDSGYITNTGITTIYSSGTHEDIPVSKSPVKRRRVRKRAVKLTDVGIKVMTIWYERNMEHPYPTYETIQVLSKVGNISIEQVQKWFSNRRMRDRNTKPLRIIAERRKRFVTDDYSCSNAKRVCY